MNGVPCRKPSLNQSRPCSSWFPSLTVFDDSLIYKKLIFWSQSQETPLSLSRFYTYLTPKFPSIVYLWWITSFLLLPPRSSYNAFWLQLNTLFCLYWVTWALQSLRFPAFVVILCFNFSAIVPLVLMLYFLLNSSFLLCLMFFHRPLRQSSIWIRYFGGLAISSSIGLFRYGSLHYLLLAITPTLLHTNLTPALKRFISSSKFFTLILQIMLLMLETVILTLKVSILRSEGIRSPPLNKKRSFPLRISSVNITKSAVSCGFCHIYWRNT